MVTIFYKHIFNSIWTDIWAHKALIYESMLCVWYRLRIKIGRKELNDYPFQGAGA